MKLFMVLSFCLVQGIWSQSTGNNKQEQPLPITIQACSGNGCSQENAFIVMDVNWRWTHTNGGSTNCYTGNLWDGNLCPDPEACTNNCAVDGVDNNDWGGTYGVSTSGSELALKFVTHGPYSTNIGSRTYLLDSSKEKYRMFNLLNQEFTFDVDLHTLDCGLNGALYFVEMDADGGKSKFPSNKGGAKYGTGYCDAQCPHDLKWINGKANCKDWKPSGNDPNSGTGHYGTCCGEMDIWEANSQSQAFTTHPCASTGQTQCEGSDCGDNITGERYDGLCDKDGCDFASYRLNDHKFYGKGSNFAVDSTQKMTVVTQFITSDNTANGDLKEIRRFYVQNGRVITNSKANFDGLTSYDSITDAFCHDSKALFGDFDDHAENGGLKRMGAALKRGMVLVMSLWDDHDANMLWLDSNYPSNADPNKPGIARGPCPTSSGVPSDVEAQQGDATVRFSNIKIGAIGSTTAKL